MILGSVPFDIGGWHCSFYAVERTTTTGAMWVYPDRQREMVRDCRAWLSSTHDRHSDRWNSRKLKTRNRSDAWESCVHVFRSKGSTYKPTRPITRYREACWSRNLARNFSCTCRSNGFRSRSVLQMLHQLSETTHWPAVCWTNDLISRSFLGVSDISSYLSISVSSS